MDILTSRQLFLQTAMLAAAVMPLENSCISDDAIIDGARK
jgi:hypothetical protein